jgi:hypothetical protein
LEKWEAANSWASPLVRANVVPTMGAWKMGVSLLNALGSLFILSLAFAIFAFPTMKFYARPIPAVTLFGIAYWIFLRVALLLVGLYVVALFAADKSPTTKFAISLFSLVVGGWLVSTELAKRGYTKPFPGIGTRTVVGMVALSWVAFGIGWTVMRFVG